MSGIEPFLFGSAATAATATTAATAATTGLFGTAGAFALAPTLSTVGGTLGALGAISAGQASANAADYNAQMAKMQGEIEAGRIRAESKRYQGQMRAAIAKSGATASGTPLIALAESASNAEIDALNAAWSGGQQADVYRSSAKQYRREGYVRAGTSLLSTASRFV